jgi:hypothetical protein
MTRRQQQTASQALFPLSVLLPSSPCPTSASITTMACPVGVEGLAAWAAAHRARPGRLITGGLRFAFYWRMSTEDNQDPVTSRSSQLGQALPAGSDESRR